MNKRKDEKMDINELIGQNLQELRAKQNMSIGQLAEQTGLSKAVISQIEKGNANPTINTIWKLAGALHVPYSAILEQKNSEATKVEAKNLVPQNDEDGHYRISCYFSSDEKRDFELFLLEFDPKTSHVTEGHVENSQEYVVVKKGALSIEVAGKEYSLKEGDALFFDASARHVYKNISRGTTQAFCINYYPKKGR